MGSGCHLPPQERGRGRSLQPRPRKATGLKWVLPQTSPSLPPTGGPHQSADPPALSHGCDPGQGPPGPHAQPLAIQRQTDTSPELSRETEAADVQSHSQIPGTQTGRCTQLPSDPRAWTGGPRWARQAAAPDTQECPPALSRSTHSAPWPGGAWGCGRSRQGRPWQW